VPMQPVLAIICGSVVGFSLGLIGGGGSILAVPLLVYVVGVYDPHVAIGTSAQAVGINAFVNLIGHWRRGNVKWPCAAADAGAGVTGAAAGSTVGKAFDGARSSLQSLTAIPVKKLRVDSGLIGGTSGGTHPARLFDATIAAARALDIPVCATRVDSPDLLIAAERRGCVSAQGIALGRPSDGDLFLALVCGTGVDTASLPMAEVQEGLRRAAETATA